MSKGLEALKHLYETMPFVFEESRTKMRCLEIIEKELKEIEQLKTSYLGNLLNEETQKYICERLKAFDIIKTKHVDFHHFYKMCSYGLQEYNDSVWENECLTREEFELLEEVLL